jgi:superoxide dismutase, Cu-Zn family
VNRFAAAARQRGVSTNLSRYVPGTAVAAGLAVFVAAPALAGADRVSAEGRLVPYASVVPEAATAQVEAVYDTTGNSTITLRVAGLAPNTDYGAHAHAEPCGERPKDAGPDFALVPNPDPAQDGDWAYENSENEIWLDFTTDDTGAATADTTVGWQFSPERRAGSVIIHAEHTTIGPRDAGAAGARLACLSVDF